MNKILILQMRPEDEACHSEFQAILRAGNMDRDQVERLRVEQLDELEINPKDYAAIIAGGSPFDVTCPEDEKTETQKRIEIFFKGLFDQIIDLDFPFMGICSGNGLLGNYYHTTISGKYAEPISSVMVSLTEEGKKDALLSGLPEQFRAFVGHKEACDDVPPGAKLLVSSANCPIQMFRIKENIYATQFHPEADSNEFILRIKIYNGYGYFKPDQADDLINSVKDVVTPVPKEILRRFVDRYLNE